MDLTTAHGRAQAIADGGQAADLARIVEDALDTHSSDRERDCWETLNGINIVFPDDLLDLLDRVADRLSEPANDHDRLVALQQIDELREKLQALEAQMDAGTLEVKDAMEILDR